MKFFALAALLGLASADNFPGFDSFHAHCQTDVTVDAPCDKAIGDLASFIQANKDIASPPGQYKLVQSQDGRMTWATRLTANGKYTDDVMWQTSAGTANSCSITAKSRSQSLSVYDYNVNFCNMYNPLRATNFKGDIVKDIKVSNCKYPATDANTCDRY